MLQLRPNCELCDADLAPGSALARICSYECTFCADCVETVLGNVCPNCGGGFVARPIRPATERRAGVSLAHQPPSGERIHTTAVKRLPYSPPRRVASHRKIDNRLVMTFENGTQS